MSSAPPGRGSSAAAGERANSGSTLSIIKAQIVFLLSTISEDSYSKNEKEINGLIESHGADANVHLIRRLIQSSAPALAKPPDAPTPQPEDVNAKLNLVLLGTCTKKLARDPLLTHRFREAVLAGFNDTSSGSASSDAFRLLGDKLPEFCDRSGLNGLERLVLALEMTRVLVVPAQAANTLPSQQTPSLRSAIALHAKSKDFGLAAAQLLRQTWSSGVAELASGQASDSLGPVALSRLVERTISDFRIDMDKGEMGIWDASQGHQLLATEQKRDLLRAVRARLGAQLASHVALHALESSKFAASTSPISILHRLIPDPASSTIDVVNAVLQTRMPNPPSSPDSESMAASLLSDLVELYGQQGDVVSIDPAMLVQALAEYIPRESPLSSIILHCFDAPPDDPSAILPPLPEKWALKALAGILSASPAAAHALWGDWISPARQLSLLERLLCLPSDLLPLGSLPDLQKVVSVSDIANASPTVRGIAQSVMASPWNCTDLHYALVRHAASLGEQDDPAVQPLLIDVLDRGIKVAPELVLLGMVQLDGPRNQLQTSTIARLMSSFFLAAPKHQLVFYRLWQMDPSLVASVFQDAYAESELNVARIVDIAQELHILIDVLELPPWSLSLDAAALATRREFLEPDRYLQNNIMRYGASFVKEVLTFVSSKVTQEMERADIDPPPESKTVPLSAKAVAAFLRSLRHNSELFSGDDVEQFKEVRTRSLQLHPSLLNFDPAADQDISMSVKEYGVEPNMEVDTTFRRMYEGDLSVDNVITLLQSARDSGDPRRFEFYGCMMHGLMEEMRFVAAYPPKELTLTAHLFGSIIQNQVVNHIPLGIAVRYVLDALKRDPNSAAYQFGVQAVSRFGTKLQEWPTLANAILNIPHVSTASPEIAAYARAALADPGAVESMAIQRDSIVEPPLLPFPALQPSEQASEPIEQPDNETSDKILFTINNLAPSNLEAKVADASERLQEAHYRWLANYLVAQRVCIEPNNHALYLQFLDQLSRPPLHKHVLIESFAKSSSLLNSEKTVTSSTERTLLKNLGSWLGAITLARNKPIKHDNLAFKELLIQGFDCGRLIVAIPFVCKILEQCSKSRVFKPPNPWLMAIIRLLVELYHHADLKLNLKFEIEVLCKSLSVELKEIEPTAILRNRPSPEEQAEEAKAAAAAAMAARAQDGERLSAAGQSFDKQTGLLGTAGSGRGLEESITAAIQSLPAYISFNPALPFLVANPSLKRAVFVAIDRALREIIVPVVERSVTIAGISTKELTLKDFAMEGDEDKLRKAALLMVQNLAGSLALVTCKEPLRLSIVQHLKTLFLQSGFSDNTLPEQPLHVIANDNLELACSVVEGVAMERAHVEIDDTLAAAFLSRRRHRETSSSSFWDPAAMPASQYTSLLPDPLRLKPNGLQMDQLGVYAEFARMKPAVATDGPVQDGSPAVSESVAPAYALENRPAAPTLLTVQQAVEKFNNIIGELDAALHTQTVSSLAQLPANSDIAVVLTQLPVLAARSVQTDDTALACSQKVVQLLFRSTTDIGREVYATLLQRLCQLSEKVAKEVVSWLIYAEDERKYDCRVTVALIKLDILPLAELEGQLSKSVLRDPKTSSINFLAQLIRHLLNEKPPLASREQLVRGIEALAQTDQAGKGTETSSCLLEELRVSAGGGPAAVAQTEDREVKEKLTRFFVTWVRVYQQSTSVEKSFVDYVMKLQDQGVLKGEDLSSRFFRTCTEVCVELYIKQIAAGGTIESGIYQPVDALGTLIAFMLKYHGDGSGDKPAVDAKAFYLTKVVTIVALVLAQSHEELGPHFAVAQKPFFRLISSLFSNLHSIESHLGNAYPSLLVSLGNCLSNLQPTYFPGFSFSWIALISHRLFMPKLMRHVEGQALYLKLLTSFLRFLNPLLRASPISETTRALYMATTKLFLVLLHDYPEFLAAHHNHLCDALPLSCIQLQNIILSAFPMGMRLPDPFAADAVDSLDFVQPPVSNVDYSAILQSAAPELLMALSSALDEQGSAASVVDHKDRLLTPTRQSGQPEVRYTRRMVTAVVMHIVSFSIQKSIDFEENASGAKTILALLNGLDVEGQYTLLSSFADQLRYPNTHSRWVSSCFLHMFDSQETNNSAKEVLLRVLLERVSCMRPHPWALIFTLVELLRRHQPEDMECLQRPELRATFVPLLEGLRRKC